MKARSLRVSAVAFAAAATTALRAFFVDLVDTVLSDNHLTWLQEAP